MNARTSVQTVSPASLGNLRDWLDLLAALRDFNQPISTPEGLRQAIALLLRIGGTLGIDLAWLAQLGNLLNNPAVFDIVLAIERYLLTLIATKPTSGSGNSQPGSEITIQALSLSDWLAIITQLLQIVGKVCAAK